MHRLPLLFSQGRTLASPAAAHLATFSCWIGDVDMVAHIADALAPPACPGLRALKLVLIVRRAAFVGDQTILSILCRRRMARRQSCNPNIWPIKKEIASENTERFGC